MNTPSIKVLVVKSLDQDFCSAATDLEHNINKAIKALTNDGYREIVVDTQTACYFVPGYAPRHVMLTKVAGKKTL